eukprot:631359-Prymnesium_polylepis.2
MYPIVPATAHDAKLILLSSHTRNACQVGEALSQACPAAHGWRQERRAAPLTSGIIALVVRLGLRERGRGRMTWRRSVACVHRYSYGS